MDETRAAALLPPADLLGAGWSSGGPNHSASLASVLASCPAAGSNAVAEGPAFERGTIGTGPGQRITAVAQIFDSTAAAEAWTTALQGEDGIACVRFAAAGDLGDGQADAGLFETFYPTEAEQSVGVIGTVIANVGDAQISAGLTFLAVRTGASVVVLMAEATGEPADADAFGQLLTAVIEREAAQ